MQIAENQNHPAAGAGFTAEFVDCWNRLPNKAFFLGLLAAWLLLFQFLGNATFGYVDTSSLFQWMYVAYKGNDWEEGHGLLIPIAVLVLLWWKKSQLLSLNTRVWWPALILLAGALLLHMLGYLVQQPRLSIISLYCGIYALTGLAWGQGWMRATFFPMFLFIFCIPFATLGAPVTTVTFYMRIMVAKIVAIIGSHLMGMDVVRDGTQLYNATQHYGYDVAAACSGLRSTFAILALSTIYGFVSFDKNWKRLVMVASAFPLAMLGNTARMMGILIAAEYGGQQTGNFVHENIFFSLLPYVPAFIGLMALGHWLRERPAPPPQAAAPATI
ncbi:MAG TPA: exosortase/archaeosortase family protein [Verrucomicrobiae bacterium]|nr:exosortase/archaeosortase family protein [Verrucomicrobiae bacterium]